MNKAGTLTTLFITFYSHIGYATLVHKNIYPHVSMIHSVIPNSAKDSVPKQDTTDSSFMHRFASAMNSVKNGIANYTHSLVTDGIVWAHDVYQKASHGVYSAGDFLLTMASRIKEGGAQFASQAHTKLAQVGQSVRDHASLWSDVAKHLAQIAHEQTMCCASAMSDFALGAKDKVISGASRAGSALWCQLLLLAGTGTSLVGTIYEKALYGTTKMCNVCVAGGNQAVYAAERYMACASNAMQHFAHAACERVVYASDSVKNYALLAGNGFMEWLRSPVRSSTVCPVPSDTGLLVEAHDTSVAPEELEMDVPADVLQEMQEPDEDRVEGALKKSEETSVPHETQSVFLEKSVMQEQKSMPHMSHDPSLCPMMMLQHMYMTGIEHQKQIVLESTKLQEAMLSLQSQCAQLLSNIQQQQVAPKSHEKNKRKQSFVMQPQSEIRDMTKQEKFGQFAEQLHELAVLGESAVQQLLVLLDLEFDILDYLIKGNTGNIVEQSVDKRNRAIRRSDVSVVAAYDSIIDLATTYADEARGGYLYAHYLRKGKRDRVSESRERKNFLNRVIHELEYYYSMVEKMRRDVSVQ